ncbi:hypothetical protein K491DRAFT_775130 [Lophiostoma macrostomum CBS 122681]|uniref:Uncharacterized protein n=1 Tax=Lophiostoma macrostomum CBS 122681 TaxID=1314788 RepID=A0A6A6TKZ2_9PLEO|nr:hypothetical protein K491DRAFT_775130 [Lophiostoma macrostomum CBS 122681]
MSQNVPNVPQNPDDLLVDIPDMDAAVADFNSVPGGSPPFRDIPSVLIGHLNRPNITASEPDWGRLLWYFLTERANHGFANLQDLHIFVVRIAVPNAIIRNRRFLLEIYNRHPGLPYTGHLRYDSSAAPQAPGNLNVAALVHQMTGPHIHPDNRRATRNVIPLNGTLSIPTRPIFRSQQNPSGVHFRAWLHRAPNPLVAGGPVPGQMAHQPSPNDPYLDIAEATVRSLDMDQLLRRTVHALRFFWWLSVVNSRLQQYQRQNWDGIGDEF